VLVCGRLYNQVTVPLSEREQKILQEIERDLYREDPTLARAGRHAPKWGEARKARIGALTFVAGFLALIAFFVVTSVTSSEGTSSGPAVTSLALGVAAFAAMVGGIVLFVSSLRALGGGKDQPRDRLVSALQRWQARMRERYKRR
jgi:hypothetical protein